MRTSNSIVFLEPKSKVFFHKSIPEISLFFLLPKLPAWLQLTQTGFRVGPEGLNLKNRNI